MQNNWQLYANVLIPTTPPHLPQKLTSSEQQELIKKYGAYFLRYHDSWDVLQETNFWYVIKDNFDGFSELSTNTRNKIRRGQKLCDVRIVEKEEILKHGYDTYVKKG